MLFTNQKNQEDCIKHFQFIAVASTLLGQGLQANAACDQKQMQNLLADASKTIEQEATCNLAASIPFTRFAWALCPDLPWPLLNKMAVEIFGQDQAVLAGTSCLQYLQQTHLRAFGMVTDAYLTTCQFSKGDLESCIREIACKDSRMFNSRAFCK